MEESRRTTKSTGGGGTGGWRRVPRAFALVGAVVALAVTGGLAACGDDNEGPAEEAGQAVDEAGQEAGQEIEEETKDAKDKE
jgi:hypothetical protein